MKTFDFVIIGGGAAGMAAAIACKKENPEAKVLILEKKSELGKKILATGNGRCNVSNLNYEHYHVVKKFFDELGLLLKEEAEGRLYPYSGSAKDVRDLLEIRLRTAGVNVSLDSEVKVIESDDSKAFSINYEDGNKKQRVISTQNLLIATGGKAAPQYGSSGDGYAFAKKLGHRITKLRPVLTSIVCKEELAKLKGVRVFAKAELLNKISGERQIEKGEVQFTDYGISGICIFNLSSYVILRDLKTVSRKEAFSDYVLHLDFMPEYSIEEVKQLILNRFSSFGEDKPHILLTGLVPNKLALYIINKKIEVLYKEGKEAFVQNIAIMLKAMEISIVELRGWNYAQCTGGGIASSEICPKTFESYILCGLYFAGEILDYHDICGGYNLSNAFFSGICVGRKVGRCIE